MSHTGIALSGKAGAGKNHLASHLSSLLVECDLWPYELGFAEGPKAELYERLGLRKEDPGGRNALVDLAHSRRLEDPLYWVGKLALRLARLECYGALPLITDMRYQNEYDWARRAGFLLVRVEAPLLHRRVVLHNRGEDPDFSESDHPSETELDEAAFDMCLFNDHEDPFALARFGATVVEVLLGEVELVAASSILM